MATIVFRLRGFIGNLIDSVVLIWGKGHQINTTEQILGHSDPAVTMRYAHLSVNCKRAAAESAARRLGDVG